MALKRYCDETDIVYSAWHRPDSIERFMDRNTARTLSMIDIDWPKIWVEYEDDTGQSWPIGLIETARDIGKNKNFTVTMNLAKLCGLPSMCSLYSISESFNPADKNIKDIEQFRVKKLTPVLEKKWELYTPKEYADLLIRMRSFGLEMLHKRLFELFPSAKNP